MALSATIYNVTINLSHVDRHVYETISVKAAQHPSESAEYFVARLLAYALEYNEGITFSRGISDPDEPTIAIRDLTGTITGWIEVGVPDAARLHKASKAAPRVAVYTHKEPRTLLKAIEGERIHRVEKLEVYALDRELIAEVVERLDRRLTFDLSVTEGTLYLTIAGDTLSGTVDRIVLG